MGFGASEHLAPPPHGPAPPLTQTVSRISRAILSSSCPKEPGSRRVAECWMQRQRRKAGVSLWSSPSGSTSVMIRCSSVSSTSGSNSSCSGRGRGRAGGAREGGGAGPNCFPGDGVLSKSPRCWERLQAGGEGDDRR